GRPRVAAAVVVERGDVEVAGGIHGSGDGIGELSGKRITAVSADTCRPCAGEGPQVACGSQPENALIGSIGDVEIPVRTHDHRARQAQGENRGASDCRDQAAGSYLTDTVVVGVSDEVVAC